MNTLFSRFALATAIELGKARSFVLCVLLLIAWAAWGPFVHYSDVWQLVLNSATSIATILMLFILQNSQNRDIAAIHLKLNEVIRVTEARNSLIGLEDCTEEQMGQHKAEFSGITKGIEP